MEVGDKVRAVREQKGITQAQLAEAVGVHTTTVTLWENHRNRRQVTDQHLHKIAQALGVHVTELIEGTDYNQEPPPASVATINLVEKVLLDTFRRLPEHVQTLQLAQLIECERISRLKGASAHSPSN